MAVTKRNFGKNEQGQEVTLYNMKNQNGMVAEVTDYGAIFRTSTQMINKFNRK